MAPQSTLPRCERTTSSKPRPHTRSKPRPRCVSSALSGPGSGITTSFAPRTKSTSGRVS